MEKRTTPTEVVAELYNHSGVVVFIFDPIGRLLITREKHDKETAYGRGSLRKPDQLGLFTETREIGEHWVDTFFRGLYEEFGLDDDQIQSLLELDLSQSFIGETKFRESCLASVLQIKCKDPQLFLNTIKPNTEIDVIGWISPDFFLKASKNIRFGVKKVLGEIGGPDFGKFSDNLVTFTKFNLEKLYSMNS
ncbi:MAG TPA: NUDIX domain-containing protein [Candidatus Saccharimonadales bacterium]|jgi:isopentenyldiphosphate isomerase|nr:NUDIX domain-containing protein [Candidatus Saccharimonadales bacterium]